MNEKIYLYIGQGEVRVRYDESSAKFPIQSLECFTSTLDYGNMKNEFQEISLENISYIQEKIQGSLEFLESIKSQEKEALKEVEIEMNEKKKQVSQGFIDRKTEQEAQIKTLQSTIQTIYANMDEYKKSFDKQRSDLEAKQKEIEKYLSEAKNKIEDWQEKEKKK